MPTETRAVWPWDTGPAALTGTTCRSPPGQWRGRRWCFPNNGTQRAENIWIVTMFVMILVELPELLSSEMRMKHCCMTLLWRETVGCRTRWCLRCCSPRWSWTCSWRRETASHCYCKWTLKDAEWSWNSALIFLSPGLSPLASSSFPWKIHQRLLFFSAWHYSWGHDWWSTKKICRHLDWEPWQTSDARTSCGLLSSKWEHWIQMCLSIMSSPSNH